MFRLRDFVAVALVWLAPATGLAQFGGHGPDSWRVTGVAPDDRLNMRTGPGTRYMAIDALPPDARGLRMVACVPHLGAAQFHALSDAQRAALPLRWCLVESRDGQASGWVSATYLAEDSTPPQAGAAPLVDEATALVRHLYASRAAGAAPAPLRPADARAFFFADVAARFARGAGSDPLFGTQDARITGLEVRPAPQGAMQRGMITVHADFRNFGEPQRAVIRIRVDPALDPPAPRIFRIEHEGWSFP